MTVVERARRVRARPTATRSPSSRCRGWRAIPVVGSVIAGATKPEQIRANAAATVAWKLTPEERAEVDAIARVEA